MNSLNNIKDLFENISNRSKFFWFFVKKKPLDIYFEESINEKWKNNKKVNIIFIYLASFNKLNDEI